MQVLDERKRQRILETAARLFLERSPAEVRLEDVAAAASVGKGTIYVYFASKSDLCRSLLWASFEAMIAAVRAESRQLAAEVELTPRQRLRRLAGVMAAVSPRHTYLRDMEQQMQLDARQTAALAAKRNELHGAIETALRQAILPDERDDARPDLTARFLLAIAREAAGLGDGQATADEFLDHVSGLLGGGWLGR